MKLNHLLFSLRLRGRLSAILRAMPGRPRARVRYVATVPQPLRAAAELSTLGALWTTAPHSHRPECSWSAGIEARALPDSSSHRTATRVLIAP